MFQTSDVLAAGNHKNNKIFNVADPCCNVHTNNAIYLRIRIHCLPGTFTFIFNIISSKEASNVSVIVKERQI